jgi:signal transduction histidine kinase
LSLGLLLLSALGLLAAWCGTWLIAIMQQALISIAPALRLVGTLLLPVLLITLGIFALLLVATMVRRTWYRSQQAATARVAADAAHQAQEAVLEQVRMLEHAHLKSAVLEAQMLLDAVCEATTAEQRELRLKDVAHSLNRLYRLVVELHGQVTQKLEANTHPTARSALPNDLERTLQEVTRNYRTLIPRCTLEVAGQPSAEIPAGVRNVLMMMLYNALSNVQRHGQAQSVQVRLEYRLGAIVLTVRDDGRGFDVTQAQQCGGRGIHDMRTLAEEHGGDVVLRSAIGQGTEIVLTLPLTRPTLGWAADAGRGHNAEDSDDIAFTSSPLATGQHARAQVAVGAVDSDSGRYGDYARTGARSPDPPWLSRNRS